MSPRELHSAPFILAILTLLSAGRASGQAASVAPAECPVELAFFQPPSLSEGPSAEAFWIAAPARLPLGSPTAQAPALVYSTDPAGGPAEEVVLERLFGAGDRLEGRYVRAASNRLQQSGEAAPGKDGLSDFRFEPNDPETEDCLENIDDCAPFDAVNAYYHVDRFATEFWRDRMGFDPPFQADVVTHISGDGAFADAPRDLIKLAAGWIFMRNAAKEDEIIYHEYTHLVAAALGFTLDINSGVEAQAVSEGYADYFAASYTNEPRIGEWVVTCPPRFACDGPPNDTDLRRLDSDPFEWNWQGGSPESTLKYGICTRFHTGDRKCKTSWNNYVPRYTWAIIWGGLLWDVREALGADLADAIVFEAMRSARGDSETLSRAAGRLVEADLALNNGENRGRIESMAAERGVAVQTRVEASTGAPPFAVDVFPTPVASGSVSIVVRPDKPIGTLTVDILDVLGRRVAAYREPVNGLHPVTFSWPAASALPGLYFVRISGGASSTMRSVTVVR